MNQRCIVATVISAGLTLFLVLPTGAAPAKRPPKGHAAPSADLSKAGVLPLAMAWKEQVAVSHADVHDVASALSALYSRWLHDPQTYGPHKGHVERLGMAAQA